LILNLIATKLGMVIVLVPSLSPLSPKQWFLNVQEMAKRSCLAIDNEETVFYPRQWENTYFAWMREPKNWCISRQLWWGHQIPVFYCQDCNHQYASEEESKSCPKCSSDKVKQDPDVLDTWFSSALWPMSTLGWPDPELMKERKYDTFFPTSVLVTGYDIIFFWVARMMMMSLKFTNKAPFEKIYIHAIVRDKMGRKMSKSLGNGIDPLEMVDLYGADAFRFTLAAGSGYNRGINLDPDRIGGYRNFINKIWNAFRFISPYLIHAKSELPKADQLDAHEKWILSELNSVVKTMNESMEEFRYDDSCAAIYGFVYDKLCSWFIELSKTTFNGENQEDISRRATVLKYTFRKVVALLHPITPYITEELWENLKDPDEDLLIIQEYPEFDESLIFTKEQEDMNRFVDVITTVRNLRASVNIKPKEEIKAILKSDIIEARDYFQKNEANFLNLARVKELVIGPKDNIVPKKALIGATTHTEVFIPLEGVIDIDDQVQRLKKDLQKTEKELEKYAKKLNNQKFLDKAPDEVKQEVQYNFDQLSEKVKSLQSNIEKFEG
jgi:valyl-tRNA synthetase